MLGCSLKPVSRQAGLFSISWHLHFSNKCALAYSAGHIHNRDIIEKAPVTARSSPKQEAVCFACLLWRPLWPQLRSSHCSEDFSHWQVSTVLSPGCQPNNSGGNKRDPTTNLWPPVSLATNPVQQSVLNLEIWQTVIQSDMLHLHETDQQLRRKDRDLDANKQGWFLSSLLCKHTSSLFKQYFYYSSIGNHCCYWIIISPTSNKHVFGLCRHEVNSPSVSRQAWGENVGMQNILKSMDDTWMHQHIPEICFDS